MRKNKLNWLVIIFCLLVCLLPVFSYFNDPYRYFSQETRDWIKWYSTLTPEERLAISYFPAEIGEAMENGFVFDLLPE